MVTVHNVKHYLRIRIGGTWYNCRTVDSMIGLIRDHHPEYDGIALRQSNAKVYREDTHECVYKFLSLHKNVAGNLLVLRHRPFYHYGRPRILRAPVMGPPKP